MFFALFHTGILIVLGFGGSGLEDSGVQLALATLAVLTGLWTFFFMDDVMQDLFAAASDLPEDFASSNLGRRFDNVPVGVFRVVNLVVIALIVIAEVLAIYCSQGGSGGDAGPGGCLQIPSSPECHLGSACGDG